MRRMTEWIRQSRGRTLALAALLLSAIGTIDYGTSYDIGLILFYLFPIMLVSWSFGRRIGTAMAACSALVWLSVDLAGGHLYDALLSPFWNAAMRLGVFLIVAHLVAALQSALESERALARTDALTGLTNRRQFLETLGAESRRSGRYDHPFSVAFIDVDDFKTLNDTWGHHAGDQALRLVAEVLRRNVRDIDVVSRIGGDEYAILLPECGADVAKFVANRFFERITEAIGRQGWPIGLSVGMVTFRGADLGVDDILSRADELMYQAKRAGKNGIRFAVVEGAPKPPRNGPGSLARRN